MHARLAASLFVLGLADLAYLNLGVGPQLYATTGSESTLLVPPALAPVAAPREAPARLTPPAEPVPDRAQAHEATPEAPPVPEPTPVPEPLPAPEPVLAHPAAPEPPAEREPAQQRAVRSHEAEPERAAVQERTPKPAPVPVPEPAPGTSDALAFAEQLTVPFPTINVADMDHRARETVLNLGLRLREHPSWIATVVGHTDARGSRTLNFALGTLRARVVAQLLKSAGVPAAQIRVESRGEDEPKLPGNSEEAWTTNRRVELAIRTARSETP